MIQQNLDEHVIMNLTFSFTVTSAIHKNASVTANVVCMNSWLVNSDEIKLILNNL